MIPPGRLDGIYTRIDRAQVNALRLRSEMFEYMIGAPAPFRFSLKILPRHQLLGGAEGRIYFHTAKPIPMSWGPLFSDIVTDLRFALDYLAYELVIANTGQDPPPNARGIEFPVYLKRAGFKSRGNEKIHDMNIRVQAYLQRVQPYKAPASKGGPKGCGLFLLNEMCNLYKHRQMMPIVVRPRTIKAMIMPVRCTPQSFEYIDPGGPMRDGALIARLSLPDWGPRSSINISPRAKTRLSFPLEAPEAARGQDLWTFCNGAVGTVRRIVEDTTALQWGTSMVLPEPDDPGSPHEP
jgi:hypothetical protein